MSLAPILAAALGFQGTAPSRSSAINMNKAVMNKAAGITAPFGFFDPAGLVATKNFDNPEEQLEDFARFQECEIKHGRLAMLASAGFLISEQFHPLFGGAINGPSVFAFQQTPLQTFWPVVVAFIGLAETVTSIPTFKSPSDAPWKMKDTSRIPGDMGFFDAKGAMKKDATGFKATQSKEINNGRLAMLAIAGMVAQELVTGAKLF
mmetsp:Transcript_1088/g.2849  ORF Transcript_1088/g.2849 Transcript_1088/m.2849 type:complete len:206 (+) Transcript_1088:186-803(+)